MKDEHKEGNITVKDVEPAKSKPEIQITLNELIVTFDMKGKSEEEYGWILKQLTPYFENYGFSNPVVGVNLVNWGKTRGIPVSLKVRPINFWPKSLFHCLIMKMFVIYYNIAKKHLPEDKLPPLEKWEK